MKPTDAKTPAIKKSDGGDYVPVKKRKNSLIGLLNIAGTGSILGTIKGILFVPIAFITIPIGWSAAYIVSAVFTLAYGTAITVYGRKKIAAIK